MASGISASAAAGRLQRLAFIYFVLLQVLVIVVCRIFVAKMAEAPGSGPEKARQYLGWESADIVEWKVRKEKEGRINWLCRWGEWMKEYEKWICSDIKRAFRKPSLRSVEWAGWQRPKCPCELPKDGELYTRKEVLMEPKWRVKCRPCQWPVTTYGEIGWLAQHPSCKLEIYGGNKFMQKPPLPGGQKKISSFLANAM